MRSVGPNKGNEIYCGKGIVAAKLEDVKAKLMKKGSAISPAHWSNPPCSAKSVEISPKYPWP